MSKRRKKVAPPVAPPKTSAPLSSVSPSSTRRLVALLAPLVLIGASLLAYHNSFAGPMLFDDVMNVRDNFPMRKLWPVWDAMWGPPGSGLAGRPVAQLSSAANYAVHGFDVRGYHAVNLALHCAAGLTLYGVVRRTLASPRLAPRFGEHATGLALIVALVWQIHPLLTD